MRIPTAEMRNDVYANIGAIVSSGGSISAVSDDLDVDLSGCTFEDLMGVLKPGPFRDYIKAATFVSRYSGAFTPHREQGEPPWGWTRLCHRSDWSTIMQAEFMGEITPFDSYVIWNSRACARKRRTKPFAGSGHISYADFVKEHCAHLGDE